MRQSGHSTVPERSGTVSLPGMKRGTVYLETHQAAWAQIARRTAADIQAALQGLHPDVQHVGSTAIRTISAKPIIDLVVAVSDYGAVLARNAQLAAYGIIFRFDRRPSELLYVMGDFAADTRTHHIHVVMKDSPEWENYLNFRDYLNANAAAAAAYEAVKTEAAKQYPNDRQAYTEAKSRIISGLLREAAIWRAQADSFTE